MSLTAWGLILDLIGAAGVALLTVGAGVDKRGYFFVGSKVEPPPRWHGRLLPASWLLIGAGFLLQLIDAL